MANSNFNMGRNNPKDVELSKAQLRRYISALETAIEKAYSRGKTEVALDLCEQLLDEHPGHVPTLVKPRRHPTYNSI